MNFKKGFTLIELLVVITILAVLMVSVFVALNPAKRVRDAQDGRRRSDISSILTAIHEYSVDNNGSLPTGLSTTMTEKQLGIAPFTACAIAAGPSTCNVALATDCVDLTTPLAAYLASMPIDPNGGTTGPGGLSRYSVIVNTNGIVTVKACNASTPPITVSR